MYIYRPVSRHTHTHTHTKKSTSTVRVKKEYNCMNVSEGGLQQLHRSREVMHELNTSKVCIYKYLRVSII